MQVSVAGGDYCDASSGGFYDAQHYCENLTPAWRGGNYCQNLAKLFFASSSYAFLSTESNITVNVIAGQFLDGL